MLKTEVTKFLSKYDLGFLLTGSAIFVMGIINLYSATHANPKLMNLGIFKVQIFWFCLSMIVATAVSFIRPKTFFRYSYFAYGINVILLILVLFVGKKVLGATRWLDLGFFRFQPSELMKISIVLALSRWYTRSNINKTLELKDLVVPLVITILPVFLIVVEPDLGTGLVVLLIFSVITFYRRIQWKTMCIILAVGVVTSGMMYQFGLKEYQRKRILTFLNPTEDARGSGYNALQSEIAIGSGRILGKGFKKSSQANLRYLPENHTDFVFSVFNEEHGFVGSLVLIFLFLILLFKFILLSQSVVKVYDTFLSIGLMSIIFWHTFINMAMVTGLLPIVGLPLPFMSYGGSSLVTCGICLGMATSVSNSRNIF